MSLTNKRGALLQDKSAVIYGASGAVGSAVARVFAQEGARVFLTGRKPEAVEALAKEIVTAGGRAEAAQVDALDEQAVEAHLDNVMKSARSVDVSFNAMGIPQQGIQGIPLAELPVDSFMLPVVAYTRGQFLTARAAGRRMVQQRSGVILMHTPEPARLGAPLVGGMVPHGRRWKACPARCPPSSGRMAYALSVFAQLVFRRPQRLTLCSAFTQRQPALLRSNSNPWWKA
jgi:NAD(P)-dependent dehydrogenase (short-subunit alcohol dehydrogenase family)